MKSRSSSPQTSPQVVRRYRVDSSPGTGVGGGAKTSPSIRKTSLRIEELPKPTMNLANNATPSPNTTAATPNTLLTPIPNGHRKTSRENSPTRADSLHPTPSQPQPSSPSATPTDASPSAWSSAIGHATTTGKSGRVIERLMSENDKLKRDLNAQLTRAADLEKSLQTCKPQMEALRQEKENLAHARGVDAALIARRDRKIEELRAELAGEKERRVHAESTARERGEEVETVRERERREVGRLEEVSRHAVVHAEILETSHRQLSAEYKARAERWKKDLDAVREAQAEDREKFARLEVVSEQMRAEVERGRRVNGEVVEAWGRLREGNRERLDGIVEVEERENARVVELNQEMERVVHEMRWVMGVRRNVKGTDDAESVKE